MLSINEINAIPLGQLENQLNTSIQMALEAVSTPITTETADAPVCWNDCTAEQLKLQAPGSILRMADSTFAYIPPGKGSVRTTSTQELELGSDTEEETVSPRQSQRLKALQNGQN